MIDIKTDWSTVKEKLDANYYLKFIENDESVFIAAIDGTFCVYCILNKSSNQEELSQFDVYKQRGEKKLFAVNTDGRTIGHSTRRKIGTYTYFTSADDDHSDPTKSGGDDDIVKFKWRHVARNISEISRSSNVATAVTTQPHGFSDGDLICIDSVDESFQEDNVSITVTGEDSFTYANIGDDQLTTQDSGTVGGENPIIMYAQLNTIYNETHIGEGGVKCIDADNDEITFEIIPQLTQYTSGSNTNYLLYGGFLILPSQGSGNITVESSDIVLVQNVPNEFGERPAGYWDATFNPSTKQFENIQPNPNGTGEFNMFGAEVVLFRFVNKLALIGSVVNNLNTSDISQIGHGGRVKITIFTEKNRKYSAGDHSWSGNCWIFLCRKKTC